MSNASARVRAGGLAASRSASRLRLASASSIAAESRAKIVYERLISCCDDPGSKDALQFLMTREITHMKAFMLALDSLGKGPLEIGSLPPTAGLVDQYFNDSTGEGDQGEKDMIGPWNNDNAFERVDNPAFSPERMALDGPGSKGGPKGGNRGRAAAE